MLSKPLVLPRGYESSSEKWQVRNLSEDLRDGGAVLEAIMRLEQERANTTAIEYKKRPKSEKFKLQNWELVQQWLGDTVLDSHALVSGDSSATLALVESLVAQYSIRDSTVLRTALAAALAEQGSLDAAINSAAVALLQDWHLS